MSDIVYTLTVNIESAGTGYQGSHPSIAGHMWYRVQAWQDGQAISTIDAGYTSHGIVGNDDIKYVGNTTYSQTMVIDAYQFNSLATFGNFDPITGNAISQAAINEGFASGDNYKVLTNSCIDFVYSALHKAGLNPTSYQGDLVPAWNQNNIDKMFGYIDEQAKEILPYMIMENTLNPENQQIVAAMYNEGTNGTTIGLDDDSTIYLVSNSLEGLGNVISGTRLSPNGVTETTNSYFTGVDGTLLGNIKGYDPANGDTTLQMLQNTTSALLEAFQGSVTQSTLIAAGVATSPFAYKDSLFGDYGFYTQDDSSYGLMNENGYWDYAKGDFTSWTDGGNFANNYGFDTLGDNYAYLNGFDQYGGYVA